MPKKFKQISVCQKADGNYFLGEERSADCGIHATRDHNNMIMRVPIELLALEHCWSISTGSCLTTLLTA
jgi:hypothetical protein